MAPSGPAPLVEVLRRFTVDEFHRMIDADVFAPDERFELLEGMVTSKVARGPRHDATVARAAATLRRLLDPQQWMVREQSAVTLGDSEPEPDIAIATARSDWYAGGHPTASELACVIEVGDTSLEFDRTVKQRIYARVGIPTFVILDVRTRVVELLLRPDVDAGRYRDVLHLERGSIPIAGVDVPVDELFV